MENQQLEPDHTRRGQEVVLTNVSSKNKTVFTNTAAKQESTIISTMANTMTLVAAS